MSQLFSPNHALKEAQVFPPISPPDIRQAHARFLREHQGNFEGALDVYLEHLEIARESAGSLLSLCADRSADTAACSALPLAWADADTEQEETPDDRAENLVLGPCGKDCVRICQRALADFAFLPRSRTCASETTRFRTWGKWELAEWLTARASTVQPQRNAYGTIHLCYTASVQTIRMEETRQLVQSLLRHDWFLQLRARKGKTAVPTHVINEEVRLFTSLAEEMGRSDLVTWRRTVNFPLTREKFRELLDMLTLTVPEARAAQRVWEAHENDPACTHVTFPSPATVAFTATVTPTGPPPPWRHQEEYYGVPARALEPLVELQDCRETVDPEALREFLDHLWALARSLDGQDRAWKALESEARAFETRLRSLRS